MEDGVMKMQLSNTNGPAKISLSMIDDYSVTLRP